MPASTSACWMHRNDSLSRIRERPVEIEHQLHPDCPFSSLTMNIWFQPKTPFLASCRPNTPPRNRG